MYSRRSKFITVMASISFTLLLSLYVVPLRNVVFYPIIQEAWRDLSTSDLVRIQLHPFNTRNNYSIPSTIACGSAWTPLSELMSSTSGLSGNGNEVMRVDPQKLRKSNNLTSVEIEVMLSRGLGRFIPNLTFEEKLASLELYSIAARALEAHGISFFFTAGSLLGTIRHGGFIPWDDDLDLGIYVKDMNKTRLALGCIETMDFFSLGDFHWKFVSQKDKVFPYIDIFFYDMDDRYVWALTSYISKTFIYLRENVFPLARADFEGGISVPVPGKSLKVLNRIFGYSLCKVKEPHVKKDRLMVDVYPDGYSVGEILCKDLTEFYNVNYV